MEFITGLFPYQEEAVEKLSHVKVGALYMEMGTGKTRTALELIKRRLDAGKVEQALWLCPYSTVRSMPELVAEHVCGADIIMFAGIESLSNSERIFNNLKQYVEERPTYLIVDESLLVKNPYAYRTKNVISISNKCKYKLILNGTPTSKNIADLYAQWYVLDWRILGYQSFWSFSANHLEFDPDRPGRVVRAHNTDYLAYKIAPYTYEVEKKDVLSLPHKLYKTKHFRLTDEQDDHYDKISEELVGLIDERRPETIYRLLSATKAITSGFAIRLDGYHSSRLRMYQPCDNPRIQALMDVLLEIGDAQAVIYCQFTQEIDDIVSILGDKAIQFHGELSQKVRQENKNLFKAGEKQYLVANKSCAQFGLNLQFCHNEVFYNNDWDWGTRQQAEDRLHRVGQDHDVHIYDIVAEYTVDVTVMRCLEKKEDIAGLFKAAVRKNNKKTALNTLLRGGCNGKDLPE